MRTQTTRTIAGRVNVGGAPAGAGYASRQGSTGQYVITFPPDFHVISASASASGGNVTAIVSAITGASITVQDFNAAAGGGIDAGCAFVAVGAA